MVVKILSLGLGGNLSTSADNFGADDDMIGLATEGLTDYTIRTYAGNDLIDLRASNAYSKHWVYSGIGNDTIFGADCTYEQYFDQSGNDEYVLNGGFDYMIMGAGSDKVFGGSGTDTVSFSTFFPDSGIPADNSQGVTCDLTKKTVQNFGRFGLDLIKGFENLQGGTGNDRFFGTNGINAIYGDYGNDLLVGRGGNDVIEADFGRDTVIGGTGFDVIYLTDDSIVTEKDIVRYTAMNESGLGLATTMMDRILRFHSGGSTGDKIDLSAIDARPGAGGNDAFIFRGTGNFTSAQGEVRIVAVSGGCYVMVDNDADKAAEMTIFVGDVSNLSANDFIL